MPSTHSVAHILQQGLAAQDAGDLAAARRAYLEAARLLLEEARMATKPGVRAQRLAQAQELTAKAEALPARLHAPTPTPAPAPPATPLPAGAEETLPEWLLAERPTTRLDDVAGLEEVKEQIRVKLVLPFTHPETAARFRVRPGGGILLYGPPGTGKTFVASAVAGELGAAFFVARAGNLMSQWFGKAEQNIAALFDAARRESRAVIFLDEIEALIPKRSGTRSSVMPRVISEFLAQTAGLTSQSEGAVLLLGATNEPWAIDPAALRPGRFDELIYVGLPDFEARLRILERGLADRPLDPTIMLTDLAAQLEGYSGADIAYICERAGQRAFLAAVEEGIERVIDGADFAAILEERHPSVTAETLHRYAKFRAALG